MGRHDLKWRNLDLMKAIYEERKSNCGGNKVSKLSIEFNIGRIGCLTEVKLNDETKREK